MPSVTYVTSIAIAPEKVGIHYMHRKCPRNSQDTLHPPQLSQKKSGYVTSTAIVPEKVGRHYIHRNCHRKSQEVLGTKLTEQRFSGGKGLALGMQGLGSPGTHLGVLVPLLRGASQGALGPHAAPAGPRPGLLVGAVVLSNGTQRAPQPGIVGSYLRHPGAAWLVPLR